MNENENERVMINQYSYSEFISNVNNFEKEFYDDSVVFFLVNYCLFVCFLSSIIDYWFADRIEKLLFFCVYRFDDSIDWLNKTKQMENSIRMMTTFIGWNRFGYSIDREKNRYFSNSQFFWTEMKWKDQYLFVLLIEFAIYYYFEKSEKQKQKNQFDDWSFSIIITFVVVVINFI